jgi:hypothetical protein
MAPAQVGRGCRKRVVAVGREGKMTAGERIREIGADKRFICLSRGLICVNEGTAREETNGLRYGGLEEAAVL